MECCRYIRGFLAVACCLLIVGVAEFRPVLIGGFFKLIASIALAYLLALVALHQTNIFQILATVLKLSLAYGFSLLAKRTWIAPQQQAIVVPDGPSLAALFQRPPPVFCL